MDNVSELKPSTPKDRWATPRFVVHWAARRWGPIGLDMAADEANAVVEHWLGQGSEFENGEDALKLESADLVWQMHDLALPTHIWCNPPYSKIDPWIQKALAMKRAGLSVTMLLPAMPGESRFGDISRNASEVIFIVGRLAFLDHDEKPVSGNTTGSCLVHFRAHDSGAPRVLWVEREVMREDVA